MQPSIRARLEAAGYTVLGQENKGRYCHGMATLCGGLEALGFLREPHLLRIFSNANVRKGHAFTYSEIKPMTGTKSAEAVAALNDHLLALAGRQVLLRGYTLTCPICDLTMWYELARAAEFATCVGCRSTFQMPFQIDFSYRLNQLFIEGMKQGATTVLLTALWLSQGAPAHFTWQAGMRLKRGGKQAEIDLIVACDGRLFVAECKDNFDDAELAPLQAQLARQADVARMLDAHEFIFATLREDVPPAVLAPLNVTVALPTRLLTRPAMLLP